PPRRARRQTRPPPTPPPPPRYLRAIFPCCPIRSGGLPAIWAPSQFVDLTLNPGDLGDDVRRLVPLVLTAAGKHLHQGELLLFEFGDLPCRLYRFEVAAILA